MSDAKTQPFTLSTSRGFHDWLALIGGSLAFTTYQAGKLFFLGLKPDGSLSIFERSFPRCMGLGVSDDGRTLVLATQVQLIRFDNVLAKGERQGIHDAVYAPHASWVTGDLDIHDVGIGSDQRPLFVNTLFNCLATVSEGHSFRPLWRPPFISRLVAEDRCHMNGMATEKGQPRYVSCVSQSDVTDGWRDRRMSGGLVIDVQTGEPVVEGLSMPHSPRLHDGRLWILNSGTGEFGWVDTVRGSFSPMVFCPGYARGLALTGRYAVVGLSRARENRTFRGLALDDALIRHNVDPRCGLIVIDLKDGTVAEWVRIEGIVDELYDVAILPRVTCPALIGFKGVDVRRVISIDENVRA